MVHRKKNLLEVLQPGVPTSSRPASASGEAPIRSFSTPRARPGPWSLSDRNVQVALVVIVLAVGGAYWLGRRHAAGVVAAPSRAADEGVVPGALQRPTQSTPPAAAPVDVAAANRETAELGSASDKSFMDRANRYTIRLIQYGDDSTGRAAANALYEHLRKQAVPVISPIHKGKAMIVVAGAAPRVKDLDALLAYVKGLRGPNSQEDTLPFKDAYPVNIDDLVERP